MFLRNVGQICIKHLFGTLGNKENDQSTDSQDMSIDIMSEIGPFLGGGLLCIINNNLNCREICQKNMY